MKSADYARLVALAVIWGASFLFVSLAVPAIGALWLTELRVGIAAGKFHGVMPAVTPMAAFVTTMRRSAAYVGRVSP
mgnify:CR=1 FL=1